MMLSCPKYQCFYNYLTETKVFAFSITSVTPDRTNDLHCACGIFLINKKKRNRNINRTQPLAVIVSS